MITIDLDDDLLTATVYTEFTLADFKELEDAVNAHLKKLRRIKVLLDLSQMTGFSVDVAWEDINFVSAHSHDFKRIAVITDDQWMTWLTWLNGAFTDAEIEVFKDSQDACEWVHA